MVPHLSQFVRPNAKLLDVYLRDYNKFTMKSILREFIEETGMEETAAVEYLYRLTNDNYNLVLDFCLANKPAYITDETLAHFYMGWYLRH